MLILPILVILLLLVSATLAASETALFSLVRMVYAREKLEGALRAGVERLLGRPFETLVTIIGLSETVNVFAECLGTAFFLFWLGPRGAYVSVPVMLVLVLVLGEITPKTFALGFPVGIMRLTARPLAAICRLAAPLARYFAPPPLRAPSAQEPVSETEFKALLRLSEYQGEVAPKERELIHRVFDFANRRVVDIMTPRDRIFSVDIATPIEEVITSAVDQHFSRVPVYQRSPGNIVGVLHVKDLVAHRIRESPPRLERLLRVAHFVPAKKSAAELLDEMRRDHYQLALVVDEYGNLLGLVTLEDLLEELFGEIRDEFDFEGPELRRVGEGEWLASGTIEMAKLNEEVSAITGLSDGDGSSLSSFLLRRLGRVPRPNEEFRLGDLKVTVERVQGARVELARLKRCS